VKSHANHDKEKAKTAADIAKMKAAVQKIKAQAKLAAVQPKPSPEIIYVPQPIPTPIP
jgi:hypothetical protein